MVFQIQRLHAYPPNLTNGSIVSVLTLVQLLSEVSIEVTNTDRVHVLELMPSIIRVEAECASVMACRACGEDTVPGELLKFYPKQIAAIIYPLIIQVMANFKEPLAWLGGISQELLKGSLPSRKSTSFRIVSDLRSVLCGAVVSPQPCSMLEELVVRSRWYMFYWRLVWYSLPSGP